MSSSCNIQKKSLVPPVNMVREKRKEEGKTESKERYGWGDGCNWY